MYPSIPDLDDDDDEDTRARSKAENRKAQAQTDVRIKADTRDDYLGKLGDSVRHFG